MSLSPISSITLLNKSFLRFPVFRVKDRNPLGHSGQRRLHAVVGSILTVIGSPHCTGLLSHLVSTYELQMSKTLNNLHKVSFLTKEPTSFGYNFIFGVKVNTKKLVSKPGSILALIKKIK